MSITLDVADTHCLVRLEGNTDIGCSTELKSVLVEAISSGKELRVDLTGATDLDITAFQLLWAAAREAEKSGALFALSGMCRRRSAAR